MRFNDIYIMGSMWLNPEKQILTLNLEIAIFCLCIVSGNSATFSRVEMFRQRKPWNILSFWREANLDPNSRAQSYLEAQLYLKNLTLTYTALTKFLFMDLASSTKRVSKYFLQFAVPHLYLQEKCLFLFLDGGVFLSQTLVWN